jgi:AICAR transformylase/IMP cyclohydrolase PurH
MENLYWIAGQEYPGKVGVSAIVQPYGSIHDAEVIDAANKYSMAMPATLERCFKHNGS